MDEPIIVEDTIVGMHTGKDRVIKQLKQDVADLEYAAEYWHKKYLEKGVTQ